jgi:outer membrane protein TolC
MSNVMKKALAIALACSSAVTPLMAQQPFVEKPKDSIWIRPYKAPNIPDVRLSNSDRLHSLMRAGRLYLTLQDAIALVIENNLDLQVDRYGPLNAEWNLARQRAGGPLRGVTSGNSVINTVTSGQGVAGAVQAAGLTQNTGTGNQNSQNGTISQIGPITPNLDPVFQNTTAFAHQTKPQQNQVLSQTLALVDVTHIYQSQVQEGLITGGTARLSFNESWLDENARTNLLNPSVLPVAQIRVQHNFLNGFGKAVNSRFIHIGEKNVVGSNIAFRSQLNVLVQNVVNLYWDMVSSGEDLRARQTALQVSEKFFDDTKRRIDLGAIARVDIFRAEADLSSRRQDVSIAQQTVSQQATQMKALISRVPDPELDAAEIVTLDRIEVPATEDLPPLRDLVAKALANRPDVALDKINNETAELSALGTTNNLLPTLQGTAITSNNGLAGSRNPASGKIPAANLVGGFGTALGEIFRHDYSSRQASLVFVGTLNNHSAQGDYGIDQLTLRQGDLVERRNRNDMVVQISNQMIAVRQARSRHASAVATRELQQDLLDKERQKFALGSSTIDLVIASERTLSAAQYAEIAALTAYSRARVALDQVLGMTLESNHVSMDEALKGKVSRESKLPEGLPGQN